MTSVRHDGQWPVVAAAWSRIGAPLRPSPADLDLVRAAVGTRMGGPLRVLILGVTPELHGLPWPAGSTVRAVDRTPHMIAEVWPGAAADVQVSDWEEMDWPDVSFDVVVCDGGWHLMAPAGQERLVARLSAVLAPGGVFVTRLFVPPAARRSPEEVIADLRSGRIADLNALKLLLGNALMPSREEGTELDRVWRLLRDRCDGWPELATELGWDLDELAAIDAYRGSAARYHFTSVAEFGTQIVRPGTGLRIRTVRVPEYPLGVLCPTVAVERADD